MRNILKACILLVSILIYSCEDQPEQSAAKKQTNKRSAEKQLAGYQAYKGPSQFSNVQTSSATTANAKSSYGMTTSKTCLNGNSIFDVTIDVAAGEYIGVDWYLINPFNQYAYITTTGDPEYGETAVWNTITFDLVDPSPNGTWSVIGVSYTYVDYDPTGVWCGPNGAPCVNVIQNVFAFSIPLPGPFVSAGSSHDLDEYRDLRTYKLPTGYTADQILDMAIDYENNLVFTYFKNGMRCKGTTTDLAAHGDPVQFTTKGGVGYEIGDIVAIDIDGDVDKSYTWFKNGKRTSGSSTNLGSTAVSYSLPAGYSTEDIIDIAIDGNVNWSWVYFNNGMKSAGSTTNLGAFSDPASYSLPCGYVRGDIAGIACDGDNNAVFTWYKK